MKTPARLLAAFAGVWYVVLYLVPMCRVVAHPADVWDLEAFALSTTKFSRPGTRCCNYTTLLGSAGSLLPEGYPAAVPSMSAFPR